MNLDFLHRCLFFNANRLSRVITRIAEEQFAETGLTPMYAYLIRIVNGMPGVSQKELAEKLYVKPSTLTRFVDKLEHKKLVERSVHGKTVLVYPTVKGQELEENIQRSSKNLEQVYREILGIDVSKQLSRNLEDASEKLEK